MALNPEGMNRFKRDRARHKLREALAITSDERFLQLIWAVDAIRSGRERNAARALDFPQEAIGTSPGDRLAIHPWELETLANQLFLVPKRTGPRFYPCNNYATAIEFVNYLRALEDAEYGLRADPSKIFYEMHRIGQRQFPWQRGAPNLPDFYRPLFLYGQGECAEYFERRHGISVSRFALVGFALFVTFMERPFVTRPLDLKEIGIEAEEVERVLPLLSISQARAGRALSELTQRTGAGAWPTAYRPSLLRRYPLIAFGSESQRLRAPLPALVLQRVTFGLYYDLLHPEGRLRNEIADRFEQYCTMYFRAMAPRFEIENSYKYAGLRKRQKLESPDILVRDGKKLVLVIECKATKLTFAAQFSDDPIADAERRYAEIANGVYQVWRYFAHCRLGLTKDEVDADTKGLVLTLDTWLVMARDLHAHVLDVAKGLAETDPDIREEDRRPILFAAAQDFEQLLSQSTEDQLISTLDAATEERFFDWVLPNVRRDIHEPAEARKKYPFEAKDLLPWWNTIGEDAPDAP